MNIYIYGDSSHSIQHIVYGVTYSLGNAMLLFWIFAHGGFTHGLQLHLINEGLSYTLIMLSVSGIALLRHIIGERTNTNINIK